MNPTDRIAAQTAGLAADRVWHLTTATTAATMDTLCGLKAVPYLALVSPGGPPYTSGKSCAACHQKPPRMEASPEDPGPPDPKETT